MTDRQRAGIDFILDRQQGLTAGQSTDMLKRKISQALETSHRQGAQAALVARERGAKDLAAFRAQVTLHAAAAELNRVKLSVARGLCTRCHANPAYQASHYHRCIACEQEIGE